MKIRLVVSVVLLGSNFSLNASHALLRKVAAVSTMRRLLSTTTVLKDCCGYGCINCCPEKRETDAVKEAAKTQYDYNIDQLERLLLQSQITTKRTVTGRLEISGKMASSEKVKTVLREAQYRDEQLRINHGNPITEGEKLHEIPIIVTASQSEPCYFWVQIRDASVGGGIVDFENY